MSAAATIPRLLLLCLFSLQLVLLVDSISSKRFNKLWTTYKKVHRKSYSAKEDKMRKAAFNATYHKLARHTMTQSADTTFTVGLNYLSDRTPIEYQRMLSLRLPQVLLQREEPVYEQADEYLPESVDWCSQGYCTDVFNQGECGACWAFAATGALEGMLMKEKNQLVKLSEQELVDCSGGYGNTGCGGGSIQNAFDYVEANRGLSAASYYPYKESDGECNSGRAGSKYGPIVRQIMLPDGDEQALMRAVATYGPIAVATDGSADTFRSYVSGVYSDPDCKTHDPNHGAVLVGYGEENGEKHWLLKNNWSTKWGESGFFKLARDAGNMCGVASYAMYVSTKAESARKKDTGYDGGNDEWNDEWNGQDEGDQWWSRK